jgi:hypothetical protein
MHACTHAGSHGRKAMWHSDPGAQRKQTGATWCARTATPHHRHRPSPPTAPALPPKRTSGTSTKGSTRKTSRNATRNSSGQPWPANARHTTPQTDTVQHTAQSVRSRRSGAPTHREPSCKKIHEQGGHGDSAATAERNGPLLRGRGAPCFQWVWGNLPSYGTLHRACCSCSCCSCGWGSRTSTHEHECGVCTAVTTGAWHRGIAAVQDCGRRRELKDGGAAVCGCYVPPPSAPA